MLVNGAVNKNNIITFLKDKKRCIVITTYASSYKIDEATKEISFTFDMKINDECHHLTSVINNPDKKQYIKMLNIKSHKQLSLTATIKHIESLEKNDSIISNDDVKYFGDILDRKCLYWAIKKEIICDYTIQTILANKEELEQKLTKFNITTETDKRLFLSAYISLKSIFERTSNHLLIYSNNRDNSSKIFKYIDYIVDDNYFNDFFNKSNLYYSKYDGDMNKVMQTEIIEQFENFKYGIIICVYCLGEGWDFPLLDSVVFAENMTSNIRIVQSALRPIRKNNNNPNKTATIILPFLGISTDFCKNSENPDFKKVREVILQMGQEDETVQQKHFVFKINFENPDKRLKKSNNSNNQVNPLGEYDEELTKNIRLNIIKREDLGGITYEKAKKIIAQKNIKNKKEYYDLCDEDNRLPKEPMITFNNQFKNWIDYLNIERKYYDLDICKQKVKEYMKINENKIEKYYLDKFKLISKLCKYDKLFPPNDLWIDYYDIIDLEDIIKFVYHKKKYIKQ